jgi:hypothetical protein
MSVHKNVKWNGGERERVDANGFLGEYQENERKRMLWVYFNVIGGSWCLRRFVFTMQRVWERERGMSVCVVCWLMVMIQCVTDLD